ncbi:STAS/SEC14 domain-containing protein [Litorimonas haliclonae]|uniref:STAS/SEC14 domain-containing protein n=1 Tax=Litorimonas haliclonae TaxID=2081977 RepID=UPI0039F13935
MIKTSTTQLDFKDGIAFMTVTGKVSEADMTAALDWLQSQAEQQAEFNLCVEMDKLEFPSLGAFKEEFGRLGEVFKMAKSMKKCALISRSGFVRTFAKVEGALWPGLEIHVYEPEERPDAVAWLKMGLG